MCAITAHHNALMSNGITIRLIVASALLLIAATATTAHAQIYTWRDGNGNLVLSDHPRDGVATKTFAVPQTSSLRATRSVEPHQSPRQLKSEGRTRDILIHHLW